MHLTVRGRASGGYGPEDEAGGPGGGRARAVLGVSGAVAVAGGGAPVHAAVPPAVVGSHTEEARLLQRDIAEGLLPGPRLWRASRMFTSVGGHPGPILEAFLGAAAMLAPRAHREVRSAADARAQVR